jgi:hypothetical protein
MTMANIPSPEDRAIVAMVEAALAEAQTAGGDDEDVRHRAMAILSRRVSLIEKESLLSALINFSFTRSLH